MKYLSIALLSCLSLSALAVTQAPYAPITVGTQFPTSFYDLGGEGVAYHDTTSGNNYDSIRVSESVDIYMRSGTPEVVGAQSEWLEYSVQATAPAMVAVKLTYSARETGKLKISVNGISQILSITSTGGRSIFKPIVVPVNYKFNAGLNIIRVEFLTPRIHLRYIATEVKGVIVEPAPAPITTSTDAAAWIMNAFKNDPHMSGNYTTRQNIEFPILVHNSTATGGKYGFNIYDEVNSSLNDRRAGFVNVNITNLKSPDGYGGGIGTNNTYGATEIFLANVYVEPNWPAWVSYDTTNYDGIVLDSVGAVYGENVTIKNWNADAGVDNKSMKSQFVNLQILGAGNRAHRIWKAGPHYMVNSTINNPTGKIVWFKDCSTVILNVYNSKFNGSSTIPLDKISCESGSSPRINYLNYDPRTTNEMHPMFKP